MCISALTNSYIFYKSDRYDIKGKQYLKTLWKYYIVDTGLRNLFVKNNSSDRGHKSKILSILNFYGKVLK